MNQRTQSATVCAITLLGFALRAINLTYHSLWFDEAISLRWAQSSLPRILEVSMNLVEDRLPPLYYLLLKGWGELAGFSEFSVRYLSLVLGVLLIPLVYRLGNRLGPPLTGLPAALLTALNPFLIWYSQEARMYGLAVLEGSVGVFCFLIAIRPASPQHHRLGWAGLGVATLAGLYTHLYTAFLWPALALWLLLNPKLLRRHWLLFAGTMGLALLLFLPLAQAIWRFSGESQPGDPLAGLGGRAISLFQAFTLWQAPLSPEAQTWTALILGGFLVIGGLAALRNRRGWLLILLLSMPFMIASILLLRSDLAFFGERYFIVMVPWLLTLQALSITTLARFRLGRWLAIPAAALLIIFSARPIPDQWSPGAAKEAWRQTVNHLTTHAQPDDAIFIHPEWVRFPYQYYERLLRPPGQTYAAFFAVDANTDLDGPLHGVVDNHPVVWLLQSHIEQPDPERRVEQWFAARYPLVTELYPPGISLKAYAPGYQQTTLPLHATPSDLRFSEGLELRGYTLPIRRLSPTDDLFHPPSNWLHLTLFWVALHSAPDVVPYAHLIDHLGQVWGVSLDRPSDALRLYPPSRWQGDQVIRQDLDINLNPATPPGDYQLVVGIGTVKQSLTEIVVR